MSEPITRKRITFALAESMREFGYPDVTDDMAGEILDAYHADPSGDLPHGVIGMLLKRQLDDLTDEGLDLGSIAQTPLDE